MQNSKVVELEKTLVMLKKGGISRMKRGMRDFGGGGRKRKEEDGRGG